MHSSCMSQIIAAASSFAGACPQQQSRRDAVALEPQRHDLFQLGESSRVVDPCSPDVSASRFAGSAQSLRAVVETRAPCRHRASRIVSRHKAKPTCMHAQLHSDFGHVVRFRKL
ncbi:hypothetical protein ZEAMMB73_Zm00001d004131 [Zea mays]|uniref:Uncharacterized protein n=1 Tax=Zea mays TaxID=4577 RepID=A0A1D6EE41_MAIZE|nr:hypothetical protein ZEAMMB73_Zm00001d004131 [Zea mays]